MTKRILICHRRSNSRYGGDCLLPLSLAAEIQKHHHVTLAVNPGFDPVDAAALFGIPLDPLALIVEHIRFENPFSSVSPAADALLAARRIKELAANADVCISTLNVVDFGRPGHHFICTLAAMGGKAFFDHVSGIRTRTGVRRALRRLGTAFHENAVKPLVGIRPLRAVFADPRERIYPNSAYVDGILRGYFGPFAGEIFYPPTPFDPTLRDIPREPLKVVYLGRLDPTKRIPDVIAIVERARALSGTGLELELAGEAPPGPYAEYLRRFADGRPWLRFVGPLHGREKETLLLSGTFAVHARRDEEFGIAVTEYLKAGLVPVVPAEGGAAEVVDDPALSFRDNEEAARNLARLVADAPFREARLRHCADRALLFSRTAYLERQNRLLRGILDRINAV